jgi:hypothetical protein
VNTAVERVRSLASGIPARSTIAVASFGAAAIHTAVAGSHLQEWGPAGIFLSVAAAAQWVVGLLVLAVPSRSVRDVAAAGSAGLIAVWAISRTVGLPLGSKPWTPETVGTADAVAVLFEVAVVIGALVARKREPVRPSNSGALIVATATATLVGLALGSGHNDSAHAVVHLGGVTAAAVAFAAYVAREIGAHGVPRFCVRLRP